MMISLLIFILIFTLRLIEEDFVLYKYIYSNLEEFRMSSNNKKIRVLINMYIVHNIYLIDLTFNIKIQPFYVI